MNVHTSRRWLRRILPVLGATVALVAPSSPASAAAGEGLVTGSVTVHPAGVNLAPNDSPQCATWLDDAINSVDDITVNQYPAATGRNTGFAFESTEITGAIRVEDASGSLTAAGTVDVTAADEEPRSDATLNDCDSGDAGNGNVELLTCAGDGAVIEQNNAPVIGGTGTITCDDLSGTFIRLGSNVVVNLDGDINITRTDAPGSVTEDVDVLVVAEFLPNPPTVGGACDDGTVNPDTTPNVCATTAIFGGSFTVT